VIAHPLNSPDLALQVARTRSATACDHVTVLALLDDGRRACRLFSEMSDVFPLNGIKEIPDGPLGDLLINTKNAQLFDGADAIRDMFWDHEVILASGVHAILNIPLCAGEDVIGTANCLYTSRLPPDDWQYLQDALAPIWRLDTIP